jgi:peptidoglycan-associated lipoprotein
MKKYFCKQLTLSVCIGSMLIIGAGCSKKTVIPPDPDNGTTTSGVSGGTNINYPDSEGNYTDNNMPAEGSLDDSTVGSGLGVANTEIDIEQQSDEYKQIHGRSSVSLQPVYFAFDQAGIQSSMTDTLLENADYINSVPGRTVVLEGNSDERGTAEYNMALGERRAITTQQYLINLSVDPRRIRTLSYGEEKPLFLGQDEDTYSLNRRVDFILK